ncbi:MAG: hypothetical protein R8P61_22340 [Bacteroidia bacterium]|nr:hypothetical protein [Bacteroidia bacterium]
MKQQHIDLLLSKGLFEGASQETELIETHISWLILTTKFVYKIKKPIQYPFLDFSSIEQREFYCKRELLLNRRLSDIYLEVLPIYELEGNIHLGESQGRLIDYAVKMKRLQASRKMDVVIQSGNLKLKDIKKLAIQIADFHRSAEPIRKELDLHRLKADFNDFWKLESKLSEFIGAEARELLKASVDQSDQFLFQHKKMIGERLKEGYVRDVHGDLHAKNIFIYDEPVIFDCIEFNDSFRQIDVLNDVAFFCMDLEAHDADEMSAKFMSIYLQAFPCIKSAEEWGLFTYFKAYRANVRAKVNLLRALQAEEPQPHLEEVRKYLQLMEHYMLQLGALNPQKKINSY